MQTEPISENSERPELLQLGDSLRFGQMHLDSAEQRLGIARSFPQALSEEPHFANAQNVVELATAFRKLKGQLPESDAALATICAYSSAHNPKDRQLALLLRLMTRSI